MSLHDVSVDDAEILARTVHSARHVRKADDSLKAELFLPYKWTELSVIRHRELSSTELWCTCGEVAVMRCQPLLGRADVIAADARTQRLEVIPKEGPSFPRNHADIINWPTDKPAQMMKAIELAKKAKFIASV